MSGRSISCGCGRRSGGRIREKVLSIGNEGDMLLSMWTEIALVVGSLALAYAVAIHFHYNEYARKTNDRVQHLSSLMSALNEHRQEEITELIERVDAAAKEVQEFKRTSVLTQKLFDD